MSCRVCCTCSIWSISPTLRLQSLAPIVNLMSAMGGKQTLAQPASLGDALKCEVWIDKRMVDSVAEFDQADAVCRTRTTSLKRMIPTVPPCSSATSMR